MPLKSTPAVEARYWAAMLIASMCGANFGDVFADLLHFNLFEALISLAALFVAAVFVDRLLAKSSEAPYWVLVLVVRAAATSVADFVIKEMHLSYAVAIMILTAILAALVAGYRRTVRPPVVVIMPTGQYWFTLLAAGILGTLVGDGVGHSFGPVSTGVPISAGLATVALMVARLTWRTLLVRSVAGYWLTLVLVRWWGTNVGDITAFLLSLQVSLVGTAIVLGLILGLWRPSKVTGSDTGNVGQLTQRSGR